MIKKLMKWMPTNYTKKSRKNHEQGQALLLVLVLLMVGILIITSSLMFMGTTLKTNKVYVANTTSLYSTEAGIQDGIWNMLNTSTSDLSTGLLKATSSLSSPQVAYSPYDFNQDGWRYSLSNSINNYPVEITLTNLWVPMIDTDDLSFFPSVSNPSPSGGFTPPSLTDANNIIDDTSLSIGGTVTTPGTYKITINYIDTSPSSPLTILSIGCWLPQGFTYNNGSATSLVGLYSSEQVLPCAGNQAVVWSFLPSGKTFSSLPGHVGNSISFTFQYSYSNPSKPYPDALAWLTDTPTTSPGHDDINLGGFQYHYTWDGSARVTDMISTAGNTEIEAFVPQSSTRAIGAAIAGDYVAIGNSLMTMPATHTSPGIRTVLLTTPSSATVAADSTHKKDGSIVEAAYLYWSGWFNNNTTHALGNSYGTRVNFFIGTQQVCFDTDGKSFKEGTDAISILPSEAQTEPNGQTSNGDYSYSCYKDVTALVKGELKQKNESVFSTDITFKVGPASGCTLGDTGNQWSYAGWSLVIIYAGPTTLGHQIYLYDKFTYADNNTDIDPTGTNTGSYGGFITGFIVPQLGTGEAVTDNAATLTAFVGEGDQYWSGDFLAINAPSSYWANPWNIPDPTPSQPWKLWDSITSSTTSGWGDSTNTQSHPDNVWNGYPQPPATGLVDGVDIKTFNIKWDTNGNGVLDSGDLLHPGDTSARIDMPTNDDSWNLVYIILSFRSSVTSGGSVSYLIRRKTP